MNLIVGQNWHAGHLLIVLQDVGTWMRLRAAMNEASRMHLTTIHHGGAETTIGQYRHQIR
jgi:hypothetical protein